MKRGVSILTSTLLLLSLTACGDGEDEIVYEESPIDLITEYSLGGGDDKAPAFYSDVFAYVAENILPVETVDPNAPVIELTKEEEKAAKAEAKKLEEANELLQKELDKENNRLSSIRLVAVQDPTEANQAVIDEATLAYEEWLIEQPIPTVATPEPSEGETEEPLSSETEVVALPTLEESGFLDDLEQASYSYTYDVSTTGYTGGQSTAGYVDYLTKSGFKIIDSFHPVNQEYYEMLTPDFTQRAGTVSLAKRASGTGRLMLLVVDWHYYGATVTVSYVDGTLWVAPPANNTSRGSLSISDAVEFLEKCNPVELGLVGNTMDDYNIYTSEGLVIINGVSFRQFNISGKAHDGNGNTFAGSYLINADGNTYSVDQITGAVIPLNVANVFDALG